MHTITHVLACTYYMHAAVCSTCMVQSYTGPHPRCRRPCCGSRNLNKPYLEPTHNLISTNICTHVPLLVTTSVLAGQWCVDRGPGSHKSQAETMCSDATPVTEWPAIADITPEPSMTQAGHPPTTPYTLIATTHLTINSALTAMHTDVI